MENIVYDGAVLIGINLFFGLLIKLFSFNKYIIISIAFVFGIFCLFFFENMNKNCQFPVLEKDFYKIAINIEITYLIMLLLIGIWHYNHGKLEILKEIKIGILVSIILFVVFHFLIKNDVLYKSKKYFAKKETFILQPYMSKDVQLLGEKMNYRKYVPESVLYQQGYHGPSNYEIQAILYYDEKTFNLLKNELQLKDQISIVLNYNWLPDDVKNEIAIWKIQPYSYNDKIFNTPNGRLTILRNKLIINFKNY